MADKYIVEEVGMLGDFLRDPRSKTLNPVTKFSGHVFAAIIDYAQERDLSALTLDDVFEYLYKIQNNSVG
jgi:hypothetical protein